MKHFDVEFVFHATEFACDGCGARLSSRSHCFECDADYCEACLTRAPSGKHASGHRVEVYPAPALLEGSELERERRSLESELRSRLQGRDGRVATFFDVALGTFLRSLAERPELLADTTLTLRGGARVPVGPTLEALRVLLTRRSKGRLQSYADRMALAGSELAPSVLMMSQGVRDVMSWRGMPLFKTAFDFSLYTMLLWELRPRTVLEVGSADGASAIWFADLLQLFGIDAHVYSMDLHRPKRERANVTFLQGDSHAIERVFPAELLRGLRHPWLVVEDAHVNVFGVLGHFHEHLRAGDYLIVEDSSMNPNDVARFAALHAGSYRVDSRYTDFFGHNATCSADSIFVRA